MKTRRRTCTNPAPAFGGRVCVGHDHDDIMCIDLPPCPAPAKATPPPQIGQWSTWGPWHACSKPCNGGECPSKSYKHDNISDNAKPKEHLKNTFNYQGFAILYAYIAWNNMKIVMMLHLSWHKISDFRFTGIRVRKRTCDSPSSKKGGAECPGCDQQASIESLVWEWFFLFFKFFLDSRKLQNYLMRPNVF